MKQFNVINFNFNAKRFEAYDVIPYFVREYHEQIERYNTAKLELEEAKTDDEIKIAKLNLHYGKVPVTFDEFKEFVKSRAQYQFWSRCEYEIILVDWPCQKTEEKWDIYDQIMMNIDIVTKILMECVDKSM
jgi:hypothetical protein